MAFEPEFDFDQLMLEAQQQSDLSKWLVKKWAKGKTSAEDLVEGAMAGLRSNPNSGDPLLHRLARINPHNAHRDLVRTLLRGRPADLPPTYMAKIPLWSSDLGQCVWTEVPFLLPHEWLSWLAQPDTSPWTNATREIEAALQSWKDRTHASSEGPPIAPISVWGDSAPIGAGHDSVLLVLWRSTGMSQWQRRWITLLTKNSMCQCGCGGLHTLDEVWRVIGWSFRALASGVYPQVSHDGFPLTEAWRRHRSGELMPMRGAVIQFRGDWQWLSYCFNVAYASNTDCCFMCRGSTTDEYPITDVSANAAWCDTCLTPAGWMADRVARGQYISTVESNKNT